MSDSDFGTFQVIRTVIYIDHTCTYCFISIVTHTQMQFAIRLKQSYLEVVHLAAVSARLNDIGSKVSDNCWAYAMEC